ncbi:MAG TPA: FkbM family methyltransferase, partial [Candidatus Obscuribacterales bacterium]
ACYERMAANMALNPGSNYAVYQSAIGDKQGTVSMDDVKGRPRITSAGKVKDGGIIPMSTIDSMVFTHPVKAIKIDVEGYELSALKGTRGTLEAYHPLVIAEALDDQAENALREYMQGLGYHVRKADDRNLIFTHA